MGNDSGRKPVRQDSPFREWVSDNLRYILLIAIIAVVVIIVVVIVSSLNGSNAANTEQDAAESAEMVEAAVTEAPVVTKAPVITEAPKPSPAEKQAEITAAPEKKEGLVTASSEIKNIIVLYFDALMAADPDAVSAVTESITENDITAITNGAYMRDYSDIEVWSYPGEGENEYVALVSYTYTYPGYQTRIPALTALYIIKGSDGNLCIASEDTEAKKSEIISKALADEKSLELRDRISGLYDDALAADPELAEYISSLSK